MAPPNFGRWVNPILIKGGRLCPPNNTGTPKFSDLPTALHLVFHEIFFISDVPTLNLKGRWDHTLGDEYDFLVKETENLKRRNGKKQNWATTDECNLPPPDFESHCDLLLETNAKSVKNWFQKRFHAIRKPSVHPAYKVTEEFKKLLKENNYLGHQVKEKKQKCESAIGSAPSSSTSNHASPTNFKIMLFIFTCVCLYH